MQFIRREELKKTKYIISSLMIGLVFLFIGEAYLWHLDGFEAEYSYVTMYLGKEQTQPEMLSDIVETAKEQNVEVFAIERKINSLFSESVTVYMTPGAQKTLDKRSRIASGEFQSVFLGDVKVEIRNLAEIPDVKQVEVYYMIGAEEDILGFKQRLIDKYGGKFPQAGYKSYDSLNIAIVWIIVLFFFLLMTLYEVAQMRKEVVVRIICGERIQFIVLKNIILDASFYAMTFGFIMAILSLFSQVSYCWFISVFSMLIFLTINSILYLTLYFCKFKRDMGSRSNAKHVLKIAYLYKVVVVSITALVLSSSLGMIYEGIIFYKQKGFFEKYKDYSYVELSVDDSDVTDKMRFAFYKKYLSENRAVSLVNLSVWSDSEREYLFADSGTMDYLLENISELRQKKIENKVYFLIPKQLVQSDIYAEIKEVWESYYPHPYDYVEFVYQDEINILSMVKSSRISSSIKKNPIIIFNNMNPTVIKKYWNDYIIGTAMYQVKENEWQEYVKSNSLENEVAHKTNAFDHFNFQWQTFKRGILTGVILSGILMLLEVILIKTICRYEYNVNAVELTLKKISGFNLFSRYKQLFLSTIGFGLLGVGSSILLDYFLELSAAFYMALGGSLLIIVELAFMTVYVMKTEKRCMQEILKGGTL